MGLIIIGNVFAKTITNKGASPFGEIKNNRTSIGYKPSLSANPNGSFSAINAINETIVGKSSDVVSGFVIHSGLLKPSPVAELIFLNSFE